MLSKGIPPKNQHQHVTLAGLVVALGIIYGDIGTSPLYVLDAIMGDDPVDKSVVLGGLSCIFWTLTFQTTLKYIVLTLQADNHGEGGIFSLYALVRSTKVKWLIFPAILGGSALLADGIITPPISVSSAIEGLRILQPEIHTIPIVVAILAALFFIQHYGTGLVGKFFGPVMLTWFIMIGTLGIIAVSHAPGVFAAIDPRYGYELIRHHPGGFWLLGAVFLCTTGAEALYSDLGHCGRANIRISWIFVKTMLILNYFGQGAWLLQHQGIILGPENPFYAIMPKWFLFSGIIIATCATIVASQALISGSYTLVNEAMRLNFWPKSRIKYPTNFRGQLYIPSVNWLLFAGCVGVVFYFRESEGMQAAYGLAITLAMMMTTSLLVFYLRTKHYPLVVILFCLAVYMFIEVSFLIANLMKFSNGGWITLLIAGMLAAIMIFFYKARKTRHRYLEFVRLDKYLSKMTALSTNEKEPLFATNLVYLTVANRKDELEARVLYSIFHGKPKKAETYWFIHVNVVDDPYSMRYEITELVPDKVIKIDFHLGFRLEPRIGLLFNRVLEDMVMLNKKKVIGDFRFVILEVDIKPCIHVLKMSERFVLSIHDLLKWLSLSDKEAFGLQDKIVYTEDIPLSINIDDIRVE